MRSTLILSLALAAPLAVVTAQFSAPPTCSLIVYRDYDFYFYYHPSFYIPSTCVDGTVLQVRKVSLATINGGTRPLNVWPETGNWIVSIRGTTIPSRFKLTAWTDKWQYRPNTNNLWKDAVTQ